MRKLVPKQDIVLLLCDIRSAHNVGSIFRTADATGVRKIFLGGHTPAPLDRFGRKRKDIAKVALGAEESIVWESAADPVAVIRTLKKEGFEIISVEQDERSVPFKQLNRRSSKLAIVLGSEVRGLPRKILDVSDVIAEIPMRGKKESLNVSVAAGVILYQLI